MKDFYGFKIVVDPNLKEYEYKIVADPNIDKISEAYIQIAKGIEQELIDHMPPESKRKLLYQLLDSYTSNTTTPEETCEVLDLMATLNILYGLGEDEDEN